MIGPIIISILVIILFAVSYDKIIINTNISKRNELDNNAIKIKLIPKELETCKKYKTFVSPRPQDYRYKESDFETEQDKFIDEYVFQSKLYKPAPKTDITQQNLANYRERFFDFRNKTNIDTNMITEVDNINEMKLLNPDLEGKSIGDIYDSLTSNKQNMNFNPYQ
jgi:hypothetical protein